MNTLKDYDFNGKRVIIRCDLNVPMSNNEITDDTRIIASLESINYLISKNAKVIILSHLGKVKKEEDKEKNSLYKVYLKLKDLLATNVYFSKDTCSNNLTEMANMLKEKDVMLVENTRFEDIKGKKESSCDLELSKYWASLGDIFVNDAYGALHRAHASTVGIAQFLPNAIGFLVEEEINKIDNFLNEKNEPFVVIMGGKKVSDKIKVIDNLIKKCDKLLIGGAMSFTFLYALGYKINNDLIDYDSIDYCKNLLFNYGNKINLPVDFKVSSSLESDVILNKTIAEINDNEYGYDIGDKTIELFKKHLENSGKVLMNGPVGVFENDNYSTGTYEIYKYLDDNKIKTLIGGGDSASSINKLGFAKKFYHVSTGGGATLEYLEGKTLPGLEVINKFKKKNNCTIKKVLNKTVNF